MKIKWGALVVDGSGKLGGHVASKNKGGNYLRTKVTPANPQTAEQSNVRSIFATISSGWSSLTESNRLSFADKVGEYSQTNIFGDLKSPTAKALYQRLNQNLLLVGRPKLSVCPSPTAIPTATFDAVVYVDGSSLSAEFLGSCTGSYVVISATPPMSAGTSFVKNKLRVVSTVQGDVDFGVNIMSDYVAKFGVIPVNSNIVFAVKFINANGQASPMQQVKLTFL